MTLLKQDAPTNVGGQPMPEHQQASDDIPLDALAPADPEAAVPLVSRGRQRVLVFIAALLLVFVAALATGFAVQKLPQPTGTPLVPSAQPSYTAPTYTAPTDVAATVTVTAVATMTTRGANPHTPAAGSGIAAPTSPSAPSPTSVRPPTPTVTTQATPTRTPGGS